MYHTEPPTDKTIREWYMNSSRVAACALRNEQAVRAYGHDVAGLRPATSWVHYTTSCNTQSGAPEDGQNNFPKQVELIGIVNNPVLMHLVGCLYYLY